MKTHLLKIVIFCCFLLLNIIIVNAATISIAASTSTAGQNGLNSSPVYPQSNVVLYGIAVTSNGGASNITSMTIPSGFNNLSTLFTNGRIFYRNTNSYIGSTQITASVIIGTNSVTVTSMSQNIANNATGYFFLVMDYTYAGTATFANNAFNNTTVNTSASGSATAYAGSPYYELRPTTVNYTSVTTGLTPAGTGIYPQDAVVLYGFSAAMAGGTGTVTSFIIGGTNGTLPIYFTDAKLYKNTTNTFVGSTPVAGAVPSVSGSTITFTGLSQVLTTTTVYYYLVVDYSYTGTTSSSIQFNSVTGNLTTAGTNFTGTFYNLLANTVAFNNNTTGLPANNTSYLPGATAISMFSFSINVKGTATFSAFNINSTGIGGTIYSTPDKYLGNGKLYVNSTATMTGATQIAGTGVAGTSVTFNGSFVNVTGINQTLTNSTTTGITRYYFLVADYIVYTGFNPGAVQFRFSDNQASTAVTQTAPVSTAYNNLAFTGNTYFFNANVSVTSYTGDANGITTSILNYGDNEVVFAVGVTAVGTLTINQLSFLSYINGSPGAGSNYFGSGTLYSSNDANFLNALPVTGATLNTNAFANGMTFTGFSNSVNNTTKYYFVKLNYSNVNVTAGATFQFRFVTAQAFAPIVQTTPSTNYNNLSALGPVFNTGVTYDWAGGSSSFTTASNFRNLNNGPGAVPTQYDQVRIGVVRYASGNAQPTIALGNFGTQTLGKIIFGTFNSTSATTGTPVLTVTGTIGQLTLSGGLGSVAGSSGNLIGTNNLITLSTNAVSNLAGSVTLTGGGYTNNGNITIATGATITHTTSLTGFTNTGQINLNGTGSLSEAAGLANSGIFNLNGTGTVNVEGDVSNTGTMTIAGGDMTFAGDNFDNTSPGTFKATGGTVNFDRAGDQAISNTTTTAEAVKFNNLTISRNGIKTLGGAGSAFEISSTGVVSVTTTSGSTTTALNAGAAKLTLNSDANGSTRVDKLLTGASITGTVNVERYFTGNSANSRGYRLLSSPVSVANNNLVLPNLTYIKANAWTTGSAGGNFDGTGNPTLYFYRENKAPDGSSFVSGNYRGVSKINNTNLYDFSLNGEASNYTLPAGNGFLFFFRGDKATTLNPTVTSTIAKPATFTATGYLNQGTIAVRQWTFTTGTNLLYTTATANTAVRGFNLVGNPYASSINWDTYNAGGMTGSGLSTKIWVYNPILKVYATYIQNSGGVGTNFNGPSGTANIIPSGQGFFVRATAPNPTLTFTEQAKVTNQVTSATLLMSAGKVDVAGPLQYLRLQLYQDSLNNEDALIFMKNSSKESYLEDEDAEYLRGNNTVKMSTFSADKKDLAINALPYPKKTETVIPVNAIITSSGLYQIRLSEAKNIPALYEVYLKDAYKKDSLDMLLHKAYNFNAVAGDSSTFGSKRFKLVIRQKAALALRLLDFSAAKVKTGAQLSWITENEKNYTNFTVERSTNGGKTFEVTGGFASSDIGSYILIDKAPVTGLNQYRLKLDDINGTVTYSKIVNLMYSNTAGNIAINHLSVYPNPVISTVNLAITPQANTASYQIKITNGIGLVVRSATSSRPEWQDNVSNLLPGTYFVQVINNSTKAIIGNTKFIKN